MGLVEIMIYYYKNDRGYSVSHNKHSSLFATSIVSLLMYYRVAQQITISRDSSHWCELLIRTAKTAFKTKRPKQYQIVRDLLECILPRVEEAAVQFSTSIIHIKGDPRICSFSLILMVIVVFIAFGRLVLDSKGAIDAQRRQDN